MIFFSIYISLIVRWINQLGFEQDNHLDDGICARGHWDLVKICGGEWELEPPFT
jgi:hypothetical protein